MQNPFEFGRELGAGELVNRTEELEIVGDSIRTGSKLFVIGPRRFGKTSLLKAAAEVAQKEEQIILRYNAESFSDPGGLVKKIIEDSAAALQGKVEKIGEQIKRYFKSLRPEVSFSVTQTEWKAALGAAPTSGGGQIEFLVDALNGLEHLAEELPAGKRVALIIDEFQEILAQTGATAEKQIRSAIQTHKHTAYIFAGSKTRMLTEMTTDPSRPFYRLGKLLFIGELPRPEFARFLIDKFTLGDFFAPKIEESEKVALAHEILTAAQDVPYNVQMLAHTLWNHLLQVKIGAPEKAVLSGKMIGETLEKLIRQNDPFYTQVWNKLTAIQKKALAAVVAEAGMNLRSIDVVKRTGVSASSMQRALESLSEQDILRGKEQDGRIKYVFEDPFFAHWVRLFTF
jgi:AAA+ ATPase superfamily predicted ATPase